MHCEQVREKFVAYVDDDVRFTERICVEVHVARCFACKEELEELQNLQEVCQTVVRHPGSAGNLEDLWRRIEEQEAAARSSRVWGAENWWNAATKLAAAAVVLFVLGVTSPFVREARNLAERFQQVTSESAEQSKRPPCSPCRLWLRRTGSNRASAWPTTKGNRRSRPFPRCVLAVNHSAPPLIVSSPQAHFMPDAAQYRRQCGGRAGPGVPEGFIHARVPLQSC